MPPKASPKGKAKNAGPTLTQYCEVLKGTPLVVSCVRGRHASRWRCDAAARIAFAPRGYDDGAPPGLGIACGTAVVLHGTTNRGTPVSMKAHTATTTTTATTTAIPPQRQQQQHHHHTNKNNRPSQCSE
eukprot:362772-Chlamydomonas_euryale.AAC.2